MPAQALRLPPLREELSLHPGPRTPDGAPSWTLHDPAAHRFYRVGWAELEMLSRWHRGDAASVAASVAAETTIPATSEQVEGFAKFLWGQGLLQAHGDEALGRLKAVAAAHRPHWLMWLLKTYLSIRLPLVRPDRILVATLPLVSLLYTRTFLALTVLAALLGGHLALRQWDAFRTTFLHFFSLEGALLSAVALTGAKVLHELGHAYTARRLGCRVPSMGVVFLVLWPVLYTDVSEAWKLPSRRQRLAIGAAGLAAELVLAAYATLAWSFLPDGPLRSAVFLLASSTWLLTLAVNLNPLMRFDGYFLLSDWLDVPNLQDRAFALARWRLREALFGFGDPAPEVFAPRTRRILLVYAYATWVYRFFLFLGIALLVYHVFFKLLGLFLMAVEIGWFIVKPVAAELSQWARRRGRVRANRHALVTGLFAVAALALALLPWRGTVSAPAILKAAQQTQLFVPKSARLAEMPVKPGVPVAKGDVLFRFESPDLANDLAQARRKVETLRERTQVQSLSRDLIEHTQSTWRELEAAQTEAAGLEAEAVRLTVAAPADGVVVDVADPLAAGEWLRENVRLATLIDPTSAVVEAYIPEADLKRIAVGAAARFLPNDLGRRWVPATVVSIATASSRALPEPALASLHGGAVPVHEGRDKALIPEAPIYRVLLKPTEPLTAPARIERGTVLLEGESESLAAQFWRTAVGVLIRESGL
ncbi:HlyD family efflux transporter periplasmic adaptor subunit [Azospirillum sp.]|uniref:HlyD family efflux transporter periplasmic adaptor subunit n=1 Tax=Azospirillum sp. TaxID=34012 RepID=UPI003D72BD2E